MKRIRSAFSLLYALLFFTKSYNVLQTAFYFDIGAHGLTGWNQVFVSMAYRAFLVVVGLHIARLYITLELLEDEEGFFGSYFDNMKWHTMAVEFCLRVLIIATITFRVVQWDDLGSIFRFLSMLYFFMMLWSLWMMWQGKKAKGSVFFWPTLWGLIGSVLVTSIMFYNSLEEIWVIILVVMFAGMVIIGHDLVTHAATHRRAYWKLYSAKFAFWKWGTGQSAMASPNGAPQPTTENVPPPK